LVKLYDESSPSGSILALSIGEAPEKLAARVHEFFAQANENPRFGNIFTDESQIINIDAIAIHQVFKQLRPFSLLETTLHVDGADIKGTMYEHMIGNTFRGELGQFFTHRSIVEFMVRLVAVGEHRVVYDPACGSGGFLIMCAKLLREKLLQEEPDLSHQHLGSRLRAYSKQCLVGTEINERTARVAKLNLLMHGLDYSNIYNINALKVGEGGAELQHLIAEGSIDIIFANPPFAGYEKDPATLAKFELGHNGRGRVAAVTREVLFIERIIRLLKEDGMAAIVLPQGVFSNRNLRPVRDYIKHHAQLLAVIELPDWAFIPSGTSVRGSLLFLQKGLRVPENYRVFMKRVKHIGFTSTGKPSEFNDFPATLEEYASRLPKYLVPISDVDDRLDAKLYIPENRVVLWLFKSNAKHKLVRLEDIGSFLNERRNPRTTPNEIINLIETSCVDPETLKITPKRIKGAESNYTSLKVLRAGDILISRRRAYRGAIVEVPPELDGALAISELSVLRLKPGISRHYVLEILRSDPFLRLMTIYSTGEMSSRIAEKDLRKLRIPFPQNQEELGDRFDSLRGEIEDLEQQILQRRTQIEELALTVVEGL